MLEKIYKTLIFIMLLTTIALIYIGTNLEMGDTRDTHNKLKEVEQKLDSVKMQNAQLNKDIEYIKEHMKEKMF